MVTALAMIHTDPSRVSETAELLADIEGVAEVYSVSGDFDLVAILRVRCFEEIPDLVTERIAKVPGIQRTSTMMAFKMYSRRDLEEMWQLGFEEPLPTEE